MGSGVDVTAAFHPFVESDLSAWMRAPVDELRRELELRGFGDGLPVAHPSASVVEKMVTGANLALDQEIAVVPPLGGHATARALAVCAALAGCTPDLFPVLKAAVEALSRRDLNAQGVLTTTGNTALMVVVNGRAARVLEFNAGGNALGPGNRANATVGRALAFATRILGGAVPGVVDMATMGQPAKYTFCFAENEERSPWDPLHVERGLQLGQSAVTLFGISGMIEVVNPEAYQADELLDSLAAAACCASVVSVEGGIPLLGGGHPCFLLSPEGAELLSRDGLSKSDVQQALHSRATLPTDRLGPALLRSLRRRAPYFDDQQLLSIARDPMEISIIVTGGVGIKHTFVPGWGGSSVPVTVPL